MVVGVPEREYDLVTMTRCRIAVELGPTRLRAVAVSFSGNVARVEASVVGVRPELNPESGGEWMRAVLDGASVPTSRCMLAVSRDDVVIKRLHLETPSAGELPAMVDLAMREELHLDGDAPVIDFLVDRSSHPGSNLLAAALPESSLMRGRSRMAIAKRPVGQVSLRFLGTAHLVGKRGSVACIDVSGDGVEFTLLKDADILVARAAALPEEGPDEIADAAIRETRRTWMSWQAEAMTSEIDQVVVLGEPSLAAAITGAMADLTSANVSVMTSHPQIEAGGIDVNRLWSLLGLLLASQCAAPLLDFASPRKPKHRYERHRQLGLAALGVLVVLFGLIWTWGNSRVQSMQRQLDSLNSQRSSLEARWLRFHRDRYRLAHLDLWASAQPDWVGHLGVAVDRLQPSGALVLDEVVAVLDYRGVEVPKKGGVSDWTAESSARLVLEAEAESREVGEAFRQHWVTDDAWTVATTGADTKDGKRLPFGVTIRLHSPDASESAEQVSEDTK